MSLDFDIMHTILCSYNAYTLLYTILYVYAYSKHEAAVKRKASKQSAQQRPSLLDKILEPTHLRASLSMRDRAASVGDVTAGSADRPRRRSSIAGGLVVVRDFSER